MFRPEELQENVVGAVVIDWKKLEDRAKYHEGLYQTLLQVSSNAIKNHLTF